MRAMDEAMDEQSTDRGERLESARSEIEIRPLEIGEDGTAFQTLNEEWIARYFVLEPKDRETLGDPDNTILRKGGRIFMVYVDGQAVGCVALIPMSDGVYELSKMAVSPELRGQGIGRLLLEHAIAQAKALGASSLFLGSNSGLKNAVHLYEAVGFRHVPPEKLRICTMRGRICLWRCRSEPSLRDYSYCRYIRQRDCGTLSFVYAWEAIRRLSLRQT
jgi:putative acetyltransferase